MYIFLQSTPPITFMTWFNEHKSELMQEFPDAANIELTKLAMRKYKLIFACNGYDKPTTANSHKRKLAEDDSDEGISSKQEKRTNLKLSKFENKS